MFIILRTVPGSIEFVASSSGEIDENELCTLCIYMFLSSIDFRMIMV